MSKSELEKILLDVIKQIQVLNAKKDHDIEWLCIKAIKLVEKI